MFSKVYGFFFFPTEKRNESIAFTPSFSDRFKVCVFSEFDPSTRKEYRCVFKSFHAEERFQKFAFSSKRIYCFHRLHVGGRCNATNYIRVFKWKRIRLDGDLSLRFTFIEKQEVLSRLQEEKKLARVHTHHASTDTHARSHGYVNTHRMHTHKFMRSRNTYAYAPIYTNGHIHLLTTYTIRTHTRRAHKQTRAHAHIACTYFMHPRRSIT